MKKLILLLTIVTLPTITKAQISIGKQEVNGSSTILDFYDSNDNFRGIILPAVENINNALATTTANNNGTILFDKSDNKLKAYFNNTWLELSDEGNGSSIFTNPYAENNQLQGVIIGADTSSAKGVLVLEAADKGLILPKISNPHLTVKSPYPGMMCYDTVSKSLALFDGANWNYWK